MVRVIALVDVELDTTCKGVPTVDPFVGDVTVTDAAAKTLAKHTTTPLEKIRMRLPPLKVVQLLQSSVLRYCRGQNRLRYHTVKFTLSNQAL